MMYRTGAQQFYKDKAYVGSALPCKCCNLTVSEYYFIHPKVNTVDILCKICKMNLFPPSIQLRQHSNYLYNITQSKFEKDFTLNQFAKCGWFMREQREETPAIRVPRYKKTIIYTLEYYGKTRCIRISDYPFYYDGMKRCTASTCRDNF